jgi:hypothetical protein
MRAPTPAQRRQQRQRNVGNDCKQCRDWKDTRTTEGEDASAMLAASGNVDATRAKAPSQLGIDTAPLPIIALLVEGQAKQARGCFHCLYIVVDLSEDSIFFVRMAKATNKPKLEIAIK